MNGLFVAIIGIGLLASLSPSRLIVFTLLLATSRAIRNATAFLSGWLASLIVIFTIVYAAGGSTSKTHTAAHTVSVFAEILLGVLFAVVALRGWQRRNRPRVPSRRTQSLEARLKDLRPWQAVAIGVAEEPWTLTAAAALVVLHHKIGPLTTGIAFLLFAGLSVATVAVILAYYAMHPDTADATLAELGARLRQAGPMLVVVVSAIASVLLLVDGLVSLLG